MRKKIKYKASIIEIFSTLHEKINYNHLISIKSANLKTLKP